MTAPRSDGTVSRRHLLGAMAASLPCLTLGFSLPGVARAAPATPAGDFTPNAFLQIDRAGAITLALPKTEMGQSVYTSIAMLVAEELEVEPNAVRVILPDGDSGRFGALTQETGGSTSMRETWKPVRQAAADARAALVQAAASIWKVPAAECRARDGAVLHDASGRSASYDRLVAVASGMKPPTGTPLKEPSEYRVLGRRIHRLDSGAKVTGAAIYGIDVARPGMKVATLAQSPVFGGKLKAVDEAAALKVKGVRQVVRLDDAVAVVADHYWAARKGLEALSPTWDAGPNSGLDQEKIVSAYAAAARQMGTLAEQAETAKAAGSRPGVRKIAGVYEQPFLAHATMEPGNCVLHFQKDRLDIWTGSQIPSAAREEAAKAAGLPIDKVAVHNHLMGGGFGRRLEADYILRAIQVARHVPVPLKLVWSREEDLQHDLYRPYYRDQIEADLDADGKPVSWTHKVVGASIMARLYPEAYKGVDDDAVEGSRNTPYALPQQQVAFIRQETAVPTSWWRGVGGTRSAFVVESFIDELAHAAKADPIAYRRALLTDPRAIAVLDLVAAKSGWGGAMPPGRARGVSLIHLWDTYMAQVMEVERADETGVRVARVTVAVDCGQPINPLGIEAQVEGGVVFGLSAALFGEVTIEGGRIQQSNFHDYRVLRMNEAPEIAVHIVANHESVGGMGEPPVAAVAPALANAVFALTGKRVRQLPIAKAL